MPTGVFRTSCGLFADQDQGVPPSRRTRAAPLRQRMPADCPPAPEDASRPLPLPAAAGGLVPAAQLATGGLTDLDSARKNALAGTRSPASESTMNTAWWT